MTFGTTTSSQTISYDGTPPAQERWNAEAPFNPSPYDSSIGPLSEGRRLFTLHVGAYCTPYPPGHYVFEDVDEHGMRMSAPSDVYELTDLEIKQFEDDAVRDIERVWNGKLWLVATDITRGYAHLSQPIPPPLECRIELTWVDEPQAGHLHIQLTKANTSPNFPRSNCLLGGAHPFLDFLALIAGEGNWKDMAMHTVQAGRRQANPTTVTPGQPAIPTPEQSVFAHEFGHYIGLDHPFAGRGPVPSSDEEYGENMGDAAAIQNIMGMGEAITTEVGAPWQRQLHVHGYFPQHVWSLTTERPAGTRATRTLQTRGFGGR